MKQLVLFIIIAAVIIVGGYYLTRNIHINTNIMQENTLQIIDTQVGTGDAVKTGDMVTVHYKGMLEDGTVFDESYKRGEPFSFTVGAGQVIQGWEKGLIGMQVGGKRTLTIPSEMGYGASGAGGGAIPPNATLIFEIELLKIN